MLRIDYWGIEKEIAEILRANLDAVTVTVESEIMFSPEQSPWVGVYLDRREAPSGQSISMGTRMRYDIRFTIWAWCYALEREASFIGRNQVISDIELVLMNNRTLNDKVDSLRILGGSMPSAQIGGYTATGRYANMGADFLSGGEVILIVTASAVST